MDIIRITKTGSELYTKAMELYKISFPEHEQRLPASQAEIIGNNAYHFDAVCDNGKFVGEVLYWDIGGAYYIEHFCVLPEKRNMHYGQRILDAYSDMPLMLEIDPPTDETAQRRKHFYERCGFAENPYKHIHPPYRRENSGHELVVMSSPEPLTPEQYEAFRRFLHDVVMKNAY
ncbi:MAG TPA: N-acetyltransferase [Clostridiales bacterium]|nr:N-acetyltransferase [Clostridiales bacterium]